MNQAVLFSKCIGPREGSELPKCCPFAGVHPAGTALQGPRELSVVLNSYLGFAGASAWAKGSAGPGEGKGLKVCGELRGPKF